MAYLDKIAESNRPAKASTGPFPFPPKVMIGLGIAIFAIILIMILGSALGGDKNSEQTLVEKLNLRSENVGKTIDTYNKSIKSSELRSMGSSLRAVLTELNSKTSTFLTEDFGSKGNASKKLTEEETAYVEELNTTLETAKLNGLLDRAFVREMTLQIGLFMSIESECTSRTKKSDLKDFLTTSYSNLESLYEEFSNYSNETV